MDFGASRRGVDIGPTALRLAGIVESLKEIGHTVKEDPEPIYIPIQEQSQEFNPKLKFLPVITQACRTLANRVEHCVRDGDFPLVMGGDHSIAMGTIAGLGAYHRDRGSELGVIWIDAHGDYNTVDTTPSGNIHGMPLSASAGFGDPQLTSIHGDFRKVDPNDIVVIGLRDVDPGERKLLKDTGVRTFTMADIDRLGIFQVMDQALRYLRERVDCVHVSFDMDALDPEFAPGVGTPVLGGLTLREALCITESIAQSGLMKSAEIVEVNPILDVRNQTAEIAVKLLKSLLGATIM